MFKEDSPLTNKNNIMPTPKERRVPPLPGELEAMSEPEKVLSLQRCLNVFADGLKEEQSWAVTYQVIKEFKEKCTTDSNPSEKSGKLPLRCCETLDQLLISTHGRCFIDSSAVVAQDESEAIAAFGELMYTSLDYGLEAEIERDLSPSLENLVEEMIIANESGLTSDDGGNDSVGSASQSREESNQSSSLNIQSKVPKPKGKERTNRKLSNARNRIGSDGRTSVLSGRLSPKVDDQNGNLDVREQSDRCDENTNNRVNDDQESCMDEEISDFISYDRILKLCCQHIGRPNRADNHYQNVCRAIVATAFQLEKFLNQIQSANEALKKMSKSKSGTNGVPNAPQGALICGRGLDFLNKEEHDRHLELDTSQWASLWMQCMSELRNGVTLKHCERRHSPIPTQFEMTPYEMLMYDIQHKNWKLKKSPDSANGVISLATRRNAHQIIMEHIRSRPNLVPTNRRHLKPAPPKKQTLHEIIMSEIKKPSSRALLRYCEPKERPISPFPVGNVLPDNFNKQIQELEQLNDTYDNISSYNVQVSHEPKNVNQDHINRSNTIGSTSHRRKVEKSYSTQTKPDTRIKTSNYDNFQTQVPNRSSKSRGSATALPTIFGHIQSPGGAHLGSPMYPPMPATGALQVKNLESLLNQDSRSNPRSARGNKNSSISSISNLTSQMTGMHVTPRQRGKSSDHQSQRQTARDSMMVTAERISGRRSRDPRSHSKPAREDRNNNVSINGLRSKSSDPRSNDPRDRSKSRDARQRQRYYHDISTSSSSSDTESDSTDELGYENSQEEFDMSQMRNSSNLHCFERFHHGKGQDDRRERERIRALNNLHDDSMDIQPISPEPQHRIVRGLVGLNIFA